MNMVELDEIRIQIPESEIKHRNGAGEFFTFLPNNQGLSEEYLYTHQPISKKGSSSLYPPR